MKRSDLEKTKVEVFRSFIECKDRDATTHFYRSVGLGLAVIAFLFQSDFMDLVSAQLGSRALYFYTVLLSLFAVVWAWIFSVQSKMLVDRKKFHLRLLDAIDSNKIMTLRADSKKGEKLK